MVTVTTMSSTSIRSSSSRPSKAAAISRHARGRELGLDRVELLAHHFVEAGAIAKDFKQFADGLGKSFQLAANLVAAQAR